MFVRNQPFWWSVAQRMLAVELMGWPWPVSPSTLSPFAESCLQFSLLLLPLCPCPETASVLPSVSLWFYWGWRPGSSRAWRFLLLHCPKAAHRPNLHMACKPQNLLEMLKFAVQYVNNTPHIQMCRFKYHSAIEQGGNHKETKGECFSGPVLSWPSIIWAAWRQVYATRQSAPLPVETGEMTETQSY